MFGAMNKGVSGASIGVALLACVGSTWGQVGPGDGMCCNSAGICLDGVGYGGSVVNSQECGRLGGQWYPGHSCRDTRCPRGAGFVGAAVPIPPAPLLNVEGPPAVMEAMMADDFPVEGVGVAVQIVYPRQGDLTLRLTHVETGTTVVLMSRPGLPQFQPFGYTAPNFGAGPADLFVVSELGLSPYALPGVPPPGVPNADGVWAAGPGAAALHGERSLGRWRLSVTSSEPGAAGLLQAFTVLLQPPSVAMCYANCDGSTITPILNVNDFVCFANRFAAGDPWANCDGSTTPPVLNVNDFVCYQQRFVAGCP